MESWWKEEAEAKKIDLTQSLKIRDNWNKGIYQGVKPIEMDHFPQIDGKQLLDLRQPQDRSFSLSQVEALKERFPFVEVPQGTQTEEQILFTQEELEALGTNLMPFYSYGVLNGGSATSYADRKKNSGFNEDLLHLFQEEFEELSRLSSGQPKGVTPAYMNSDGTPGASFLELKMRALLLQTRDFLQKNPGAELLPGLPMFQMTSVNNDQQVTEAYKAFKESPFLKPLIQKTGFDVTQVLTGQQPMLAALTHSEQGEKKELFTKADGKEHSLLGLPGGHGQNFLVLKEVYQRLYKQGKRFVSIGNVDNIGYTPNPLGLAVLALSGREAAFEFSFKTSVDVKGGVLIVDKDGKLNCGDLGAAIPKEVVKEAEEKQTPILFNCATGLFDLEYLVNNIDRIVEELPMRFSDQDKDAGRYSQAEQITWEVMGILPSPLVLGIDKFDRFLAAKMLLETLMTSGLKVEDPSYPTHEDPARDLQGIAKRLNQGLRKKLTGVYGLQEVNQRWQ